MLPPPPHYLWPKEGFKKNAKGFYYIITKIRKSTFNIEPATARLVFCIFKLQLFLLQGKQ